MQAPSSNPYRRTAAPTLNGRPPFRAMEDLRKHFHDRLKRGAAEAQADVATCLTAWPPNRTKNSSSRNANQGGF